MTSQSSRQILFCIMVYLMVVSERSHHKDVKGEKIFEIYLSIQKIERFESSVFRHFVTKNSTKWPEIQI